VTSDCENSFAKAKEHFLSGLSYLQGERWIEAESEFRASLNCVPDRISTLTNLSAALIKQRKYEDALTIVNRAHSIEPNSAELVFNLGVLRSENQRHDR
jgi:tetratricopeptide (TPR) repeat protein